MEDLKEKIKKLESEEIEQLKKSVVGYQQKQFVLESQLEDTVNELNSTRKMLDESLSREKFLQTEVVNNLKVLQKLGIKILATEFSKTTVNTKIEKKNSKNEIKAEKIKIQDKKTEEIKPMTNTSQAQPSAKIKASIDLSKTTNAPHCLGQQSHDDYLKAVDLFLNTHK